MPCVRCSVNTEHRTEDCRLRARRHRRTSGVSGSDGISLGPLNDVRPRQPERTLGGGDDAPQWAARVFRVVRRRFYVGKAKRRLGCAECAADEGLVERVGATAPVTVAKAGPCPGLKGQRVDPRVPALSVMR